MVPGIRGQAAGHGLLMHLPAHTAPYPFCAGRKARCSSHRDRQVASVCGADLFPEEACRQSWEHYGGRNSSLQCNIASSRSSRRHELSAGSPGFHNVLAAPTLVVELRRADVKATRLRALFLSLRP